MKEEIKQKLLRLLVELGYIEKGKEILETFKFDEFGIDSLDMIEISIAVEDLFDISIENVHMIHNFGDLINFIYERIGLENE